jgi:hypothetical protein
MDDLLARGVVKPAENVSPERLPDLHKHLHSKKLWALHLHEMINPVVLLALRFHVQLKPV